MLRASARPNVLKANVGMQTCAHAGMRNIKRQNVQNVKRERERKRIFMKFAIWTTLIIIS